MATTGGTQVNSTDTVTAAADGQTLYARWEEEAKEKATITLTPEYDNMEIGGSTTLYVYVETVDNSILENISEYISISSSYITLEYCEYTDNKLTIVITTEKAKGSDVLTVNLAESDYWYATSTTIKVSFVAV